jgi:hypothetical protein
MNIRTILFAAAAVAALSPAVTNASQEKASLQACANAFATSIASPGSSMPAYKLAYHVPVSGPMMEYPRDFTFMLEAHDKAGSAIARARCSTNAEGVVTEIAAVPLNAKSSTVAAAY